MRFYDREEQLKTLREMRELSYNGYSPVKRHVEEEKQPCRAEINETEPESGSVGVPEIHQS